MNSMNICSYKKCGKNTDVQRPYMNNRYICDNCFFIIKEKNRIKQNSNRRSSKYKEKYGEKVRKLKRDSYHRLKKNKKWNEKKKEQSRKSNLKRYNKGTVDVRLNILKNSTKKKNCKCDITKDFLTDIIENKYCYISGISLKKVSKLQPQSSFLDRIGKEQFGGNGISGGDYTEENVRPSLFVFNQSREQMGLTHIEMEKLFAPIRNSKDPKIQKILDKIANIIHSKKMNQS